MIALLIAYAVLSSDPITLPGGGDRAADSPTPVYKPGASPPDSLIGDCPREPKGCLLTSLGSFYYADCPNGESHAHIGRSIGVWDTGGSAGGVSCDGIPLLRGEHHTSTYVEQWYVEAKGIRAELDEAGAFCEITVGDVADTEVSIFASCYEGICYVNAISLTAFVGNVEFDYGIKEPFLVGGGDPCPDVLFWDIPPVAVTLDMVEWFYSCRPDVDFDGDIDYADLLYLLENWGPCEELSVFGKITSGHDFLGEATNGLCAEQANHTRLDWKMMSCNGDSSGDGVIDQGDLTMLLGAWGECE